MLMQMKEFCRCFSVTGCVGLACLLLLAGCGKSDSGADAADNKAAKGGWADVPAQSVPIDTAAIAPDQAPQPAAPAPAAAVDVDVPAPVIPDNAPVLADVYPVLAGGPLSYARLTELPDDVLLQAEGVSMTVKQLQAELAQVPEQMRAEVEKNAFFMLENIAAERLIVASVRSKTGVSGADEQGLLNKYFTELTDAVEVADADVEAFYEENRSLFGDAALEQMKIRIQQHLLQAKKQEAVEVYIRNLGRELPIAVSAAWMEKQAAMAQDNSIDQARNSGVPTFVSFGADTCIPCQQMKPSREAVEKKYTDKLNVVYVHVQKEQFLASRYGVQGIPHVIFFNAKGEKVHEHTGLLTLEQIESWLKTIGVEGA